jgi:alkyl hydroperoxide reductase subunit AhpC
MLDRFDGIQAQVLGLSVDSVPCLKAWADSLGGISYPLLSDFYPHGKVAQAYGCCAEATPNAIFVIGKNG